MSETNKCGECRFLEQPSKFKEDDNGITFTVTTNGMMSSGDWCRNYKSNRHLEYVEKTYGCGEFDQKGNSLKLSAMRFASFVLYYLNSFLRWITPFVVCFYCGERITKRDQAGESGNHYYHQVCYRLRLVEKGKL